MQGKTNNIETISNPIEFARELIKESVRHIELNSSYGVNSTLSIINHQLRGSNSDTRMLISADSAFIIPADNFDLEFMEEKQIEKSKIDNAILEARFESFSWMGKKVLTGYGLRVYGVEFLQPEIDHTYTAFIPLDDVRLALAA